MEALKDAAAVGKPSFPASFPPFVAARLSQSTFKRKCCHENNMHCAVNGGLRYFK